MVLVDTNVILDIATVDPLWEPWSSQQLHLAASTVGTGINPVIYAELAPSFESEAALDLALPTNLAARWRLPYSAAFPAARAFAHYRKTGGQKTSPLPDFFIGAHAEAAGLTLLTRDPVRYRTYFPTVPLICP